MPFHIDPFLDLRDLREHLASYYSHTGRPSVDPELMIRMLIVGYCYGIRSERRLGFGTGAANPGMNSNALFIGVRSRRPATMLYRYANSAIMARFSYLAG